MGMTSSSIKINFEDMQHCYKNPDQYRLINTLPQDMQNCLIPGTIPIEQEEDTLNSLMKSDKNARLVVYGLNSNDDTIFTKYNQLTKCGFTNLSIYTGGMFEWLLLRDVFGDDEFPVTNSELDILRYKAQRAFGGTYIT